MSDQDLVERYNYDSFVHGKFNQFMNFDASPKLGEPAPDAPLWHLDDRRETRLSEVWSKHTFTVVEFGSFT